MSKYYPPELEEFHVGFEFELNIPDKGWCKLFYPVFNINPRDISSDVRNQTRVKYLDRKDIESLGWARDSGDCDYVDGDHGQLEILNEDERGMLIKLSTGYGACMEFYGRVKNKSELIKELKKVGL